MMLCINLQLPTVIIVDIKKNLFIFGIFPSRTVHDIAPRIPNTKVSELAALCWEFPAQAGVSWLRSTTDHGQKGEGPDDRQIDLAQWVNSLHKLLPIIPSDH